MDAEERIDKWLWAMRVFKTRTIATEACKKGRVTIGGNAVKPSRTIKVGDTVDVRKPPVTYTFRVLRLSNNRLGARLVPEYLENITAPSQYELLEMTRISGFVDRRKASAAPQNGRDGNYPSSATTPVTPTPSSSTGKTMTMTTSNNQRALIDKSLVFQRIFVNFAG